MIEWVIKATPEQENKNRLKRVVYIFVFCFLVYEIYTIGSMAIVMLYILIIIVFSVSFVFYNLPSGIKYSLGVEGVYVNDLNKRGKSKLYKWGSLKNFQIVNNPEQLPNGFDQAKFVGVGEDIVVFIVNLKNDYAKNSEKQFVLMIPRKIQKKVTDVLEKYLKSYHYIVE